MSMEREKPPCSNDHCRVVRNAGIPCYLEPASVGQANTWNYRFGTQEDLIASLEVYYQRALRDNCEQAAIIRSFIDSIAGQNQS